MNVAEDDRVLVGCSGYDYSFWKATEGKVNFYRSDAKRKDLFPVYAAEFNLLEINRTYYSTPSDATFCKWRNAATTHGVRYALKVDRYITHMKKLCDFADTWPKRRDAYRLLGDTLAAVVFQMAPTFAPTPANVAKLDEVWRSLSADPLPNEVAVVFEFRHPGWYTNDAILETFAQRRWTMALVMLAAEARTGAPGLPFTPADVRPGGPLLYIKLHGARGHSWGSYSDAVIDAVARAAFSSGQRAMVVFNNTDSPWRSGMRFRAAEYAEALCDDTPSCIYDARRVKEALKELQHANC